MLNLTVEEGALRTIDIPDWEERARKCATSRPSIWIDTEIAIWVDDMADEEDGEARCDGRRRSSGLWTSSTGVVLKSQRIEFGKAYNRREICFWVNLINWEKLMISRIVGGLAIRYGRPFLWFCVAIALVGCAASSKYSPAPAAAATDYSYVIGPGDTINISVWRNPELSMSVPVRPDGKISTPLVQDLMAMGKDPKTLSKDIETELAKYIRDPVVTVVVTNIVGSSSEQVRVVGEATRPQTLPYKHKMTLLDVMIAVGGLTEFADGNAATILRTAEGNKQYSVRLKDLVKRGDISANVEMRAGDVVVIPQSWF